MSRPRERRLRDAAARIAARAARPDHDNRTAIASAVYNAIGECPKESLLVPELYGPVSVAASMSWEAIARKNGLPLTEETADEIIGYLIDGFTMMAYEFDLEHMRAHRARRAHGERLRELARERKPEVEEEMARRQATGE